MRIRELITSILFWHIIRMRAKVTGTDAGYFVHVSVQEKDGKEEDVGIMHISISEMLTVVTPTGAKIRMAFEKA
jgi:hypothetical protein